MAILITAAGTQLEVKPKNRVFSLQEFYKHIGCTTVQMIELPNGMQMWMDEEGKFRKIQHVNDIATMLLRMAGGLNDDYIVGNVLICDPSEID